MVNYEDFWLKATYHILIYCENNFSMLYKLAMLIVSMEIYELTEEQIFVPRSQLGCNQVESNRIINV